MINSTMKTFQIITLLALVAASMAFSPQGTFLDPCSHSTRIDVPELHLSTHSLEFVQLSRVETGTLSIKICRFIDD